MKTTPPLLVSVILSCILAISAQARGHRPSLQKRQGNHTSHTKIWIEDDRGLGKISVHTFRERYGVKWTGRQLLGSGLTRASLGYSDGMQSFDWQNLDAEPRIDPRYVPSAAEARAIRGHTAPLYIGRVSREVGNGLFARGAIAKGEVIGEYTGVARPEDRARDRLNAYTFVYDPFRSFFMVVDAKDRGNYLRFANHSTSHANAYSKMVYDAGAKRWHTLLIARQAIARGDQILFDYGRGYDWGRFGIRDPIVLKPR
jgi:hypothetical protein